ncbi:hypothetical protein HDE_07002 [Halotydeus destructor]|nr:hypothetical protein HDE_07002 [Halotydeus destructor]
MRGSKVFVCSVLPILIVISPGLAFSCYNCSSNADIECSEKFDKDNTKLTSSSCDDLFEARFCIKTTGIFEGEIATKRFCSSRDYGNYCEYIKRKGDEREYRSCVYTCSSDACNGIADTRVELFTVSSLFTISIAALVSKLL